MSDEWVTVTPTDSEWVDVPIGTHAAAADAHMEAAKGSSLIQHAMGMAKTGFNAAMYPIDKAAELCRALYSNYGTYKYGCNVAGYYAY